MGRKRRFLKLILFAAMLSTIGAGVLSSVPLPVKAAEEETYTVKFIPYEGTCETESVSVPKGESIILPDASYEGHYLAGWVDAVDEGGVTTFNTIGIAGSEYTPERDLLLYANWKPVKEQEITVTYEARIGDTGYEELEEAFADVQAGDTIIVLKDCSVSTTLEVTADSITLKSEDAGNPVTISREDSFTGKSYGLNTDTVLLAVTGGSLATQDIIFDGGAVLDEDFNNSGKAWNSPLIYVDGAYSMESGTVLQNNYNTDGDDGSSGGRTRHTAGAVQVKQGGSLTMDGGLIQNCYTSGGGGGIQSEAGSHVSVASGTVMSCYATWGGGMDLWGDAELSDMTLTGNVAGSSGGAISGTALLTVIDSLIEGNSSAYDGGGICIATENKAEIIGCTFTGNTAPRGSAIQTTEGEGELPLIIRDCTIRGNLSAGYSHAGGAVCYMNETGITLSGNIVMEDNLSTGHEPCDIHYFYNTGASILLDEDFESTSTFVLGGFPDVVKPGRELINGTLFHKDTSTEQFVWHTKTYCTEKRGENLYLAEVPKTYHITYDANNRKEGESVTYPDANAYISDIAAVILDEAAALACMGNLEKTGYDFACWNTEPDGSGTDYAPGQEINLTDDLYLYAKWEAKEPVTLTYIYNGGTGEAENEQAIPGENTIFPDASRKGYSFKGWYEDEDLTVFAGNAGEEHTAPQEATSYYAAWEKTEGTVTFDADGGEMEGENITAKIGDMITLPACTKEGYEFTGWYDGDICVGKAGEEYNVSADAALKAHYEKREDETVICTATFDADGGDTVRKSIEAEKGSSIILPACNKTGCEFLGWFLASDDSICIGQAGEEFTVQGDISLKAHFEKKEAVKVIITFDTDGGKEANPIKAAKGDMIRLPRTEKEGYTFLGWYTEKDGGILLGISGSEMKAVKDMTAYALWEKEAEKDADNDNDPDTCKVTFHAGKGTIKVKELTIIKDGSLSLPLPEREGYDFTGWYLDDDLTQFAGVYHDTYRITKDTDFYAKWEKPKGNNDGSGNSGDSNDDNSGETLNTYTIKYDANGGKTKNASVKVVKGGSVKLPGAEREGYTFKGWYTDRQVFIGAEGETYKPGRSISFYARWEKEEKDNQNDKDSNNAEKTNDKDNKNTSDKNQNTNGTVSGNSVNSPSDKNTETKTEGGNGNAGKGTEPVIQTGYASPFYLLAALGLCGFVLAAASLLEGKKGE